MKSLKSASGSSQLKYKKNCHGTIQASLVNTSMNFEQRNSALNSHREKSNEFSIGLFGKFTNFQKERVSSARVRQSHVVLPVQ